MAILKRDIDFNVKRPFKNIITCSVLTAVSLGDSIFFIKKQGSFDTISFCEFLKTLTYPNKTVIFMDNVSFHHSRQVKELIQDKGWD